MFTSQVAKEVGSRLGAIEEVEQRRGQDELHYFMRVRVALPISKPIRRGSFIAGSDGEKHWVKFKYERLPLFCHFCGMLGHDVRNCAEHTLQQLQLGGQSTTNMEIFLKPWEAEQEVVLFKGKQGGLNMVQRVVANHLMLVLTGLRGVRLGVKRHCNWVQIWRRQLDSAETLGMMMKDSPNLLESRRIFRNTITHMQLTWSVVLLTCTELYLN